ncbi:hypothetical protein RF11_12709 [Thelohanellus kitauei]|uniref:Uncharacterized protein n=1 Tax=Thelohanellus kitauei TaxID=669202 RepID=A0A0C2MQV7_THEKT|nr:hypothetical protein RF11_12709 [Thelohanellus kitauei]
MEAVHIPDISHKTAAHILSNVVSSFCISQSILTDQGTAFQPFLLPTHCQMIEVEKLKVGQKLFTSLSINRTEPKLPVDLSLNVETTITFRRGYSDIDEESLC